MPSRTADNVPVVDLSAFTSPSSDEKARRAAAQQLAEHGHVNGCVGISGHGMPPERLREAFNTAKKLFDLPYEEKMKAPHPDAITPHRGYSGTGREQGAAKTALQTDNAETRDAYEQTTDCKESYEIGSDDNKIQYNIWLPEESLPGFRDFTLAFYWELNKLANAILEALIMSISLSDKEAETVRALHNGHENQLRLLHYPSMKSTDSSGSRLGAHTDWSTFTLLFQDGYGGLEFEDRATGDFLSATPRDGVLYMNIGDMFQRLSNGFYPSALHRVTAQSDGVIPPRYSIPYFVMPNPDGVIAPQPSRVSADGKEVYEPITFHEYSDRMFSAINTY